MTSSTSFRTDISRVRALPSIIRSFSRRRILFSLLPLSLWLVTVMNPAFGSGLKYPELFPSLSNLAKGIENAGSTVADPHLTVRFANPTFTCSTYEYCVDVEFQSDTPNKELFGMNVRFFYDDQILEFINLRGFLGGYSAVTPNPANVSYSTAGIPWFNFSAAADYVNGAVQKTNSSAPAIFISTSGWTKLYQMCFRVDSPNGSETSFCPPLVWDLEEDPADGGFPNGSAGVVMTVVNGSGSSNAFEHVVQYNWDYFYNGSGIAPFGEPEETHCISIDCGTCDLLVTNTADSGAGSLRAAIQCAYSGDTIEFASNLAGATITITSSRLLLSKNLVFNSELSPRLQLKSNIAGLIHVFPYTSSEYRNLDITSGLTVTGNIGASFTNYGILKLVDTKVIKNPSLPTGQYLIRNYPQSQLINIGNSFIEIP